MIRGHLSTKVYLSYFKGCKVVIEVLHPQGLLYWLLNFEGQCINHSMHADCPADCFNIEQGLQNQN